jgi:pyruvate dehydrogenase (quinone)/pyruvate oxidase
MPALSKKFGAVLLKSKGIRIAFVIPILKEIFMAKTAADILVESLIAWGVDVVFGIPGDGVNGVIESLRKRQDQIRFVQVRHEETAAFAACGYAKFTGKLGVCIATSGPGGIHLLNGLYDAKLDGQPVLAVTGMQFHDLVGTHQQQDVELDKLFADVAVYNNRIMGPAHVENVVALGIRTALNRRGVAHICFPVDYQSESVEDRTERNIKGHVSDVPAFTNSVPDRTLLGQAAEILNHGKKVAILAGRGALGATDELEQMAELLGAPIIKPLLGKACVPDDSPYTTGGIGLLGTLPSQKALKECDTLLIVGTAFPYMEFMPKPGQARAVQIELDPVRIGLRYPVEVGLVGDSRKVLRELLPLITPHEDKSFLQTAQERMREWNELMLEREQRTESPMKPQVIAAEVGKQLQDNAIVTCDSGTITTWWARHIPARRGQMHSLSGNLATMAVGLPYAIAAQVAYPDRQVVAFIGDGGLSMLMAELATCRKYNLPIKIVVIKNNTLGQIKWEQMVFLGNPEYVCDLQPIDFAKVAEACGFPGVKIENPKDCEEAVSRAFSTPGPVLVEAQVDPFEPPMPADVNWKQAVHLAESLAQGEPDAVKIIKTIVTDKFKELI